MNDGAMPLYVAAQKNGIKAFNAFLQSRADVDSATNDGATPLYVAAQKHSIEASIALWQTRAT